MEYTDKYTEQHFIDFKEQFIQIAQDEFRACNGFVNNIEKANSPTQLGQVLEHFAQEIYEKLSGDDIDDLKETIEYLADKVESLENQIEDHEDLFPTLYDEMKYKAFLQLHSKYTPWEFEQLLLNGKL